MGHLSPSLKSAYLCVGIIFMDTEKLDLNLLLALDALLAERNVTRAASRLNISQPALSARLSRLRDLFGDPLLLSAQRGMIPTPRALELQDPLRVALDQVRSVISEGAAFDPKQESLTVSLAATDYVQYAVMLPVYAHLQRAAPGIRLTWRGLQREDLRECMERGEIDAAFTLPGTAPDKLRQRVLFKERYVVVVRRNHPHVSADIDLDTFCALDHIVVSPIDGALRTAVDTQLSAFGRERKVVMAVSSFLAAPELVARSDLALLVPERLVRNRGDTLQVFEPPFPVDGFSIALVWHDRTDAGAAYKWLREEIAQVCL